ncbi:MULTISPECIES: TetR/AcrR family transcriptional regulator [Pseudoalteromonas]|uniref:TetR/AcrR family transcriptional regulator n=1 Tax=Pseudoalteromonas fuliginea TaxID=1872678 RepID=A0A833AHN3_9GAMM|nr:MULTISPECIES: TetR/AcrR family transcriptional regulator [Pseudoalteromonas]KAA1156488.1 TetR/AcrR family transcriptional regulator [Pseudoalteromonas fuliginea]KAA1156653.1 TetR/AcrR family transcriptional regulator [Pseudoalteromonas fuliginea]KAA1167482.1 TetR/AcrR family transcriptional regulator [Pseudoalteromonas fuliginea]KDC55899.1 TetR family transcriptional regulator [Pseudoalteromonas sp. S3431]
MTAKAGRPKQDDPNQESARQSLIDAAKICFSEKGFDNVSTRKIAKEANVDAAMIRYYFGSKAGLFEAVMQDTLAPVIAQFQQDLTPDAQLNPLRLMQTYYRMIAATPMLPKLILHVLGQKDNPQTFAILISVFDNILRCSESWIKAFEQQGHLNPNLNTDFIRLSFMSLMVFPLLAPEYVQKQLGVEIRERWLMGLAEHNQTLLEQGLFNFPNNQSDDNEEGGSL